jgi:hypothetical protein
MNHYFTEDGNYGEANGLAIIRTDSWSEHDWKVIEESTDMYRLHLAREITSQKLAGDKND